MAAFLQKALIVLALLVFWSGKVEAASLYFSPASGSFHRDENFTVGVFVSSDVAINAIQGVINFPTEQLEVIEVKRSGINSIIDLWVMRPSYSNAGELGNVSFEGVALNPGYLGPDGKIIEVVFRVKNEGRADLSFSEFSILANDGLGTNVAVPTNGTATFTLLPASLAPGESRSEDIKRVTEKIRSLEEEIESITEGVELIGVLAFWQVLPTWVKVSALVFIGATALALSIIVLGFALVVVIWFWNYSWHRREVIAKRIELLPGRIERFFRGILRFLGFVRGELEGDIEYSLRELKHDIREAERNPSLGQAIKDYWVSIGKIIRRFLRRNTRL